MPAWLLAISGKVWAYAAAVGAALLGGLALYTSIRQGGRDAQRADDIQHAVENANVRVQEDAAAARSAAPADELRNRWGR